MCLCPNNTIFFRQGGLQPPPAPPPRTLMLALNYFSLTAKFLAVYSKRIKSRT